MRKIPRFELLCLTTAIFYVGAEWLFFVTKASFMDSFHGSGRLGAFGIPVLVILFGSILIGRLLEYIPATIGIDRQPKLALLIPSFVAGSTFFLLIDNFTYTMFRYGVIESGILGRVLYLVLFLWLWWRNYRFAERFLLRSPSDSIRLWSGVGAVVALTLCLFSCLLEWYTTDWNAFAAYRKPPPAVAHPYNVIFFATDGVEAEASSLYGLRYPTTPFLESLAPESLVFENAFSNAGKTTGSTTAMLTGVLPIRTKVGFPPQILPKEYTFRHLPAILQRQGYHGFQRTVQHYADSADLNFLAAFDIANSRTVPLARPGEITSKLLYIYNAEYVFFRRIVERLGSRLMHITWMRPMVNHYLLVKENRGLGPAFDAEGVDEAMEFIRGQDGPFFMHIHLMATHCCSFLLGDLAGTQHPEKLNASTRRAMLIRHSDAQLERFVGFLKDRGLLDKSILIFSSDHSVDWNSTVRVPLLIRFPYGIDRGLVGRIDRNVSFIDLPPTILETLGLPVPEWMQGRSLLPDNWLAGDHNPDDPVFTVPHFNYKQFKIGQSHLSQMDHPGPPFYGFKEVSMIVCDVWKTLDLKSGKLSSGNVSERSRGEGRKCDPAHISGDIQARTFLLEHLKSEGFGPFDY